MSVTSLICQPAKSKEKTRERQTKKNPPEVTTNLKKRLKDYPPKEPTFNRIEQFMPEGII